MSNNNNNTINNKAKDKGKAKLDDIDQEFTTIGSTSIASTSNSKPHYSSHNPNLFFQTSELVPPITPDPYILSHPRNTQKFYEITLVDTDSILISHDISHYKHLYSQLQIKTFLTFEDWGNPDNPIAFSKGIKYTYWTYFDAWRHYPYRHPTQIHHSWTISFHDQFRENMFDWLIDLGDLNWFDEWWCSYGAIPSILPQPIVFIYNTFKLNFQYSSYNTFDPLFCFFSIFNIPWILHWDITLNSKPQAKWCDDYNTDHLTITNLFQWFFYHPQFSHSTMTTFFASSINFYNTYITWNNFLLPNTPPNDTSDEDEDS